MENIKLNIKMALEHIENIYAPLDELHDILNEIINNDNLDIDHRCALEECEKCLNSIYLLDEVAARLGCLYYSEEDM